MSNSKHFLAIILIFAGLMHFVKPYFFIKIMPSYLPSHRELVYLGGMVEIICGLLLFFPQTRLVGAWLSIALFIAVFPANIQMAKDFYISDHPYLWAAILRLPLQLVLIWWAYTFTK